MGTQGGAPVVEIRVEAVAVTCKEHTDNRRETLSEKNNHKNVVHLILSASGLGPCGLSKAVFQHMTTCKKTSSSILGLDWTRGDFRSDF